MELGADYAECDVRRTTDGVAVIIHDSSMLRTGGVDLTVKDCTYDQLSEHDVGAWFNKTYQGERIPRLIDALRCVSNEFGLIIEIKDEGLAPAIYEAVKDSGCPRDKLIFFSFSRRALDDIGRFEPSVPRFLLLASLPNDVDSYEVLLAEADASEWSGFGLSSECITKDFVRLARGRGFAVHCWTVNEVSEIQRVASMGLDGIVTDHPDRALAYLNDVS
jgi:glycerophosphoryl diester phosphodiesterase